MPASGCRAIAGLLLVLAAPAAALTPGDANRDERVTAPDISVLLQILNGDVPGNLSADANQDGFVLSDDVVVAIGAIFGGGGSLPPPTATAPASSTATALPTSTGTPGSTPTIAATVTSTSTSTRTAAGTATATPTGSAVATSTATATVSPSLSPTRSATPSPSSSPTQPATSTPGGGSDVAASIAGNGTAAASAMTAIPPLITAIVSGFKFGSASLTAEALPDPIGRAAGACPLGGTATNSCSAPTRSLVLNGCTVPTAAGSARLDGTINLTVSSCGLLGLPTAIAADVTATFKNPGGDTVATAAADLSGTVTAPQIDLNCTIKGGTLMVSGSIESRIPGQVRSTLQLTNTKIIAAVRMFAANCVPAAFTLTFDGPGLLSQSVGVAAAGARGAIPENVALTFGGFVLDQDASASPSRTRLDGDIGSDCFGGTATLATQVSLAQMPGMACPSDGRIRIAAPSGMAEIRYLSGNRVGLDAGPDGVVDREFDSCLDPGLLMCVAAPGATPTASATPTVTASRTTTATASSTATVTPSGAVTATPTSTPPTSTASASATASAPATATTTSTATATSTATPPATATPPSATPTATSPSLPAPGLFCASLPTPLQIPDFDLDGVISTVTVADPLSIADLNVRVDVQHPFIGDLVLTLTHVETGHIVVLVENPGGSPENTFGCGGPGIAGDIVATFDTQASRFAQSLCSPFSPAIGGGVIPDGELSAFTGESAAGTWRLRVSDRAMQDSGALRGWCLEVNSRAPVVTALTCNGQVQCTVPLDQPFTINFATTDADANATSWQLTASDDAGNSFSIASGSFAPPTGSAGVPIQLTGFQCPAGGCRTTAFEFFVVVTDADGHQSPYATLNVTSLGSGATSSSP